MNKALTAYTELCFLTDREPDFPEFLAMQMFGIIPEWLESLYKRVDS